MIVGLGALCQIRRQRPAIMLQLLWHTGLVDLRLLREAGIARKASSSVRHAHDYHHGDRRTTTRVVRLLPRARLHPGGNRAVTEL